MFLKILPKMAAIIPIVPQEITWAIDQIPIPNVILEIKVINIVNIKEGIIPKISPAIIIIDVTGCTPGRNTSKFRPTIAMAAKKASKVIL